MYNQRPRRFQLWLALTAILILLIAASLTSQVVRVSGAPDPCSIPSFGAPAILSNVNTPRALVVADFNNDNKPDIASAGNSPAGRVTIFLGNGAGGFTAQPSFAGVRNVASIAAGDLNNDGKADLVAANGVNTEGELSVFLGNGTGGFGPRSQIFIINGTLNQTSSVVIGDVTGDSKADVIITSATFNSIMILTGDGAGHFTFSRSVASGGSSPGSLVLRDLNGDSKSDLVVANRFSDTVSVLLGDGLGNFGAATTFAVGSSPIGVTVGDYNGDTKTDLAIANSGTASFSVLLGDGTGNFGAATHFTGVGASPQSIVTADFNGDTKLDLAVSNSFPDSTVIFLGNGLGAFTATANLNDGGPMAPSGRKSEAIADFNADTRPDLVTVNDRNVAVLLNTCGPASPPSIQLTGSFGSGDEAGFGGENGFTVLRVVRTGDITGSAGIDYATSNGTATAPEDYTSVSGTLNFAPGDIYKEITVTLINDNIKEDFETFNFTLSNVTGNAGLGTPATSSVIIFDDDPTPVISINDVTVTEGNSGIGNAVFVLSLDRPSAFTISVNYASANGSATAGSDYRAVAGTLTFNPGEISKPIPVDINGDLLPEVNENFFVNLSSPVNVTLNDTQAIGSITDDDSPCPGPSFGVPTNFNVSTPQTDFASGDFNGDGKKDLAVARATSSSIAVLLGNGAGGFSAPTTFSLGSSFGELPQAIVAADFNLDNKLDLVTANRETSGGQNDIAILLGDGSGGFGPPATSKPVPNIQSLAAADFNGDGKPDLAVLSTTNFIGPSTVGIVFGNGAGGFSTATTYTVGTSALFLTAADLNSDGKPDIVTANFQGGDVSVLLNTGNGSFAPATNFPTIPNPNAVAAGDLNGDLNLDLVVAGGSTSGSNVSILFGNGSGGFTPGNGLTAGSSPYRISLNDFNGDGRLDFVVTESNTSVGNPGFVLVLFGNGAGTFTTPVRYQIDGHVLAVHAADFNNDSRLDLIVGKNQSLDFSVLLNGCSGPGAVMQFSNPTYTANEGDIFTTITVNRTGDLSGTSTVDYALVNGTAIQTRDYQLANGTLSFAAGEVSKTFQVLLVNDVYAEATETINLALSNPTGGFLVNPSSATVLIVDNDSAGTASPVARQFVANLVGAEEVPATTNTVKGNGGIFQLSNDELSAKVSLIFSGLTGTETGAHVHAGAPGVNGPIIFSLPNGNPLKDILVNPTAQQVADLRGGQDYMNVHSTGFQNGEIRGQLLWNPAEEADFFVRQAYFDFLGRNPDPGGFAFWQNEITQCQSDVQCLRNKRIDVSNAFFYELEFQQTAAFVLRLYRAAYGNNQPSPNPNPNASFPNEEKKLPSYEVFVADRARVIGGSNLAQKQIELANLFVTRAEFTAKYPATLATADQFVDAVLTRLQNDLGVNLISQRTNLINLYTQGGRGAVMYRLADDNAANPIANQPFIEAEYSRTFVLGQYFGYLRRDPDIAGFLFWLGQVNGAPLRDVPRQHAMVCSFITSGEYQFRFGPVASRNNNECQ